MTMIVKKFKKFEELTAKIQKDLAPTAIVKLDQKILGKNSGRKRQVDVVIQQSIGNYDIFIAIECKDTKRLVDVKSVEATIGLMKDIRATLGVIVAAKGFTASAIKVGHNAGLKLYKLIDTGDHDWKTEVTIPAVCNVRGLKSSQFSVIFFGNEPIYLSEPTHETPIFDGSHKLLGTMHDLLLERWSKQDEFIDAGYYEKVKFLPQDCFLKSNTQLIKIEITANILVEVKKYFRNWPLAEISGFESQDNKGSILTRGFTTQPLNMETLKKDWREMQNTESLISKPVITISIIAS